MVRLSTIGILLGIVLFFIPVPPFAMIASVIVLVVSVVLRLLGK
ncbi:transporter [Halohasta litorea]|uniref:Transporter n=1 Tax=Halohasta litorea TaxID=869891 RepID=A0ABD6DA84_9EURY|nr:transporter [Halohasta litorea]MEA1931948.1 transporter [Euryarchaeota archaeon]